jgi:hypothetical protein
MIAKIEKNEFKFPAGLRPGTGTEAYFDGHTKYLMIDGSCKPFEQWPDSIQDIFLSAFEEDNESRLYLKKYFGITDEAAAFDQWFKCRFGGLDHECDYNEKGIHPDYFNNTCNDLECPHRGKFCGMGSGLKNFQVKTLRVLENSNSFKEASQMLFISVPGVKNRVIELKYTLNSNKLSGITAIGARLGI